MIYRMADDREKILLEIDAEDNASRRIDQVTKSVENLGKSGGELGSASSGISNFVDNIERGISRVNNVTRRYNNAMRGLNTAVINIVKDMGSAVYDFTTDSIDNFTRFSEQHAKTLGAMAADYDNTAESQRRFFEDSQKLKEQAFNYGTYGVNGQGALMSITDVSSAQESLIKAGVSAEDLASPDSTIVKDILTFAQANDMDIEQSVQTAVSLGNQFDIDYSDWGLMLDKISHAADMSIVDVSDITQSLKWASGISSGLNRSFEETLGMITVLGDFGLKGSQAGTGIQALLTRLLTGDTTVITQAQAEVAPGNALEKFYEFEQLAKPDGNLLPMSDVIDEMNAIMEDMTDEEQAWFAKKLFGLYQMKSAYALMNGDDVDLNDLIEEIETMSEGTNENKLQQLLDSQYGQLTSLNNLWEGIKTDVGDRLSPFVDAVRDELFQFLSNDGNYDINFDNLRDALDESCGLIEEKYGSAIANAVQGLGDFTIDLTQVMSEIAPEMGTGMLELFGSLFNGDIFGKGGVIEDWGTMIDNMYTAVDGLPEDLQGLGDAVVGCIDWFGKLMALNAASEIAELISSVLQILTIAGGAVINVAGAVVVNGSTVGGGTGGTGGAAVGGAGTAAGSAGASVLSGSSIIGSADDVARALGTTADDVITTFGEQATYSIDDIAKGLGSSSDDIINAFGNSIDDVIRAGAGSIDEVATGGSKLFGALSKTGKILGTLGILFQAGMGGYDAYEDFTAGNYKEGVGDITGTVGSIVGGIAGASVGTVLFPGIGTIIGAIAGSGGGDLAGRELGESGYQMSHDGTTGIGTYDDWRRQQNEDDYDYERMQTNAQPLVDLANALKDAKVGDLNAQDWALALAYDEGREQYDQRLSGDDRLTFQQLWTEYMGDWDGWEYRYSDHPADSIALNDLMVHVTKDNEYSQYYDPSLDQRGYGYNVWAGTEEQYRTWLDGQTFIGDDTHERGDVDDAYTLDDLSESVRQGIIDGLNERASESNINANNQNIVPYRDYESWLRAQNTQQNMGLPTLNPFGLYGTDPLGLLNGMSSLNLSGINRQTNQQQTSITLPDNISSQNTTITSASTNFTGNVTMPNIYDQAKEIMPDGWAVLSEQGVQDVVNNQIQMDDSITMTPAFSVSAPNVNVNVRVDQAGNVTRNTSILNPAQGSLLNNWYSRTSSQYGRTTK